MSLVSISSHSSIAEPTSRVFDEPHHVIAFAVAFHTTPYQYVLSRCVERAERLAAATTLNVTDIAASAAFSTPSHFARAFEGRVGVIPTAYRNAP